MWGTVGPMWGPGLGRARPELVVRGRDSPWLAKTGRGSTTIKPWRFALLWCLPCFQGEWGTRVARPRTVFGFVSTARLETCENIVRIGLAFFGPCRPAGPGLAYGVRPRLGKNRLLFLRAASAAQQPRRSSVNLRTQQHHEDSLRC